MQFIPSNREESSADPKAEISCQRKYPVISIQYVKRYLHSTCILEIFVSRSTPPSNIIACLAAVASAESKASPPLRDSSRTSWILSAGKKKGGYTRMWRQTNYISSCIGQILFPTAILFAWPHPAKPRASSIGWCYLVLSIPCCQSIILSPR